MTDQSDGRTSVALRLNEALVAERGTSGRRFGSRGERSPAANRARETHASAVPPGGSGGTLIARCNFTSDTECGARSFPRSDGAIRRPSVARPPPARGATRGRHPKRLVRQSADTDCRAAPASVAVAAQVGARAEAERYFTARGSRTTPARAKALLMRLGTPGERRDDDALDAPDDPAEV